MISDRTLTAFACLDVALQAVAQLVQQVGDVGVADRVAQRFERDGQCANTLAGPAQRRVWITGRGRLHQRVEITEQGRIGSRCSASDRRRSGRPHPTRAFR